MNIFLELNLGLRLDSIHVAIKNEAQVAKH